MQTRDIGTDLDHLGDAFVPNCERALEGNVSADGSHDRIDKPDPHPELHDP
jgi:hypothetical protein